MAYTLLEIYFNSRVKQFLLLRSSVHSISCCPPTDGVHQFTRSLLLHFRLSIAFRCLSFILPVSDTHKQCNMSESLEVTIKLGRKRQENIQQCVPKIIEYVTKVKFHVIIKYTFDERIFLLKEMR